MAAAAELAEPEVLALAARLTVLLGLLELQALAESESLL
jgi:hypothetical protein